MKRLYLVLLCLMIPIVSLFALVTVLHTGGSTQADMLVLSAATATGQLQAVSQQQGIEQNIVFYLLSGMAIAVIALITWNYLLIINLPISGAYSYIWSRVRGSLAAGNQLLFPI